MSVMADGVVPSHKAAPRPCRDELALARRGKNHEIGVVPRVTARARGHGG